MLRLWFSSLWFSTVVRLFIITQGLKPWVVLGKLGQLWRIRQRGNLVCQFTVSSTAEVTCKDWINVCIHNSYETRKQNFKLKSQECGTAPLKKKEPIFWSRARLWFSWHTDIFSTTSISLSNKAILGVKHILCQTNAPVHTASLFVGWRWLILIVPQIRYPSLSHILFSRFS